MLNRRTLLYHSARVLTGIGLAPGLRALAQDLPSLELQSSGIRPVRLPPNFIGLGYEMSSVATPGLLSASNHRYVRLVRALGLDGVIRVGGIVADYTRYAESGIANAAPKNTVITREVVAQFNSFLIAIGWKVIWSLISLRGTVDDAVIEARAVHSALRSRLALRLNLGTRSKTTLAPTSIPNFAVHL